MPIRAENQWRYPPNWPEISAGIRERAWHMCEECGVENYALGGRDDDGRWWPAQATGTDGMRVTWPKPGEWAWCQRPGRAEVIMLRIIRIVLTVAHLNHRPEDNRPENLKCLCQRCHNRLDAKMRAAGRKERARLAAASGDLFG